MNLLDIILLAIALAMDCFAVSIVSGVLTRKNWLPRMAFLFGFFQALMPLIGWIGISFFRNSIEAYDHWIAFALLLLIGGNMIRESFSEEEEHFFNPLNIFSIRFDFGHSCCWLSLRVSMLWLLVFHLPVQILMKSPSCCFLLL